MKWIDEVYEKVPVFLNKMVRQDGGYKYTYCGDNYNRGLVGSSSFALKVIYTLSLESQVNIKEISNFLLKSRKGNSIYEEEIFQRGKFRSYLSAIKNRNYSNWGNRQYIRAETRQCLSSLSLFNSVPKDLDFDFSATEQKFNAKMVALNWRKPWNAGSHFSHEMFFLRLAHTLGKIEQEDFKKVANSAAKFSDQLMKKDGAWYVNETSPREKINGAMKMITGFIQLEDMRIHEPRALIDLCLSHIDESNACDNFNAVFVLSHASKLCENDYRFDEISDYLLSKIDVYKKHWYSSEGGFSFLQGGCNDTYYGVKIAEKNSCSDIHGTTLFLWGIAIINGLLNLSSAKFKIYNA